MTTPPSPIVAAFDLDGTLSKGGSVFKWLRCLCGRRATYFAAIGLARPLFVGALRSGSWADDAKERLFRRLLTGRDAEEVTTLSRTFAIRYFEEHGRPRVIERMNWHLQQGHDVVIVSASPQLYLDVVAEIFGVAGGLGTRLAVDARGQLTGSYLGKNCRGTEKLRRFTEWTEARHPGVEPIVYAYGNSRGDRRLLRAATYAFDAGRLGPVGSLRHFARLPRGESGPTATAGE